MQTKCKCGIIVLAWSIPSFIIDAYIFADIVENWQHSFAWSIPFIIIDAYIFVDIVEMRQHSFGLVYPIYYYRCIHICRLSRKVAAYSLPGPSHLSITIIIDAYIFAEIVEMRQHCFCLVHPIYYHRCIHICIHSRNVAALFLPGPSHQLS